MSKSFSSAVLAVWGVLLCTIFSIWFAQSTPSCLYWYVPGTAGSNRCVDDNNPATTPEPLLYSDVSITRVGPDGTMNSLPSGTTSKIDPVPWAPSLPLFRQYDGNPGGSQNPQYFTNIDTDRTNITHSLTGNPDEYGDVNANGHMVWAKNIPWYKVETYFCQYEKWMTPCNPLLPLSASNFGYNYASWTISADFCTNTGFSCAWITTNATPDKIYVTNVILKYVPTCPTGQYFCLAENICKTTGQTCGTTDWVDIPLSGTDSFDINAEYRYKINSARNFWFYPKEISTRSLVSNESYFGQIFYVNADTKTSYQYNGNFLDTVVQIQKRLLPSWTDVSLSSTDPFDPTYEYRFKMTVPGRPGVPAWDFWYYAKQVGEQSLVMDNGYGQITFVSAANKTAYLSQGTPTGITISQMQKRALTWTDVPLNGTEVYDASCNYRFKMNYPASPQWRPGVPAWDFWHYPERISAQSHIANANGGYQTFSVFANNKTVFDFNGTNVNTVLQMQKNCQLPVATTCSEGQYFCTAENACKPAGQSCGIATCDNNMPVSWTQFNNPSPNNINSPSAVSLGSASGNIQLGSKTIQVTYTGDVRSVGIADNWSWIWTGNTAPFLSTLVSNIPDHAHLLWVFGWSQTMNTLTFSEPVTNPILLFYSIGGGGTTATYEFDRPFRIVSWSTGIPGQGDFSNPSGNILRGTEGYGVIQFQGTFSTLSFKVPTAEYWSAFTVGLKEAAVCPVSVTCNNNNTCDAGESCNCADCTNGGTDDADRCGLSDGVQMVCTRDKNNTTTTGGWAAFSSVTAQENFNTVNNKLAAKLSQFGNANIAAGEFSPFDTELKMTQYDWKDAAGNFIFFTSFTQGEAWTKVKEIFSLPNSAQVLWSTSSIKYENDSLGDNERYLYSYVIQQASGVQKQIFFATEFLPGYGWRKIYLISKDYPLSTTTTGTEVCQNFTNPTLFWKPLALGSPTVGSSGIAPFCLEHWFRGTSTAVRTSMLTWWLTLWKSNGTGWEPNQNGDKIDEIRCCGISSVCVPFIASTVKYTPNTDPRTQWWLNINGIGTAQNDGGKLVWQVNDGGNDGGDNAVIYKKFSSTELNDFFTNGGKYTAQIKNFTASLPTSSAGALLASYLEIARGKNTTKGERRFTFVFWLDTDKTPTIIGLSDNGTTYVTPTNSIYKYKVIGGANQYNTYEMVYDPATDTVDLFVNGVERISNFPGNTVDPGYAAQINGTAAAIFGSGSSAGLAKTNYGDIVLSVKNTACAAPAPIQVGACCPAGAQWDSSQGRCLTACEPVATLKKGSELTTVKNTLNEAFSSNTTCANKNISLSPCSMTVGVVTDGTSPSGNKLYKWPKAASGLSKDYNLVEINGQCWFADNLEEKPSAVPTPPGSWDNFAPHNDYGVYAFAGTGVGRSEGYLYQFDAATNMALPGGASLNREQGVCPAGWHVATDCEFQYIEHTLGMSISEQQAVGASRTSGDVGIDLKTGGDSGFDMPLSGTRRWNTGFINGLGEGHLWSSECTTAGCYKRIVDSTGTVRRLVGDGGTYDSSHHAAGSVRCVKDGSTTPVNTCPVPWCAEGEYYCHAELKCKAAGATCGTVTCNNNAVCDTNESCDCADCNEKVDHCGLSSTGEQMICTKDTAPTCYTDKFPYCLSGCLDGYKMDTNGQCVLDTSNLVPPACTVRSIDGTTTAIATCQSNEVLTGGGCTNTMGGAYFLGGFPIKKSESWTTYTPTYDPTYWHSSEYPAAPVGPLTASENGYACATWYSATYVRASAVCCQNTSMDTTVTRTGTIGDSKSLAQCNAGEVRVWGGCRYISGGSYFVAGYPLGAGETYSGLTATQDGFVCVGGVGTMIEARAVCKPAKTGETVKVVKWPVNWVATCDNGYTVTGGGCESIGGAYYYIGNVIKAGQKDNYTGLTPTNDGYVCSSGASGTNSQPYAICVSPSKPSTTTTPSIGSQDFSYPVKIDGYVKNDTPSATKFCTEKWFTSAMIISSDSSGARKMGWNGTVWVADNAGWSYIKLLTCFGGTPQNYTCKAYTGNIQTHGGYLSIQPQSTTQFCKEAGYDFPQLTAQYSTSSSCRLWNGTSWYEDVACVAASGLQCCTNPTVSTTIAWLSCTVRRRTGTEVATAECNTGETRVGGWCANLASGASYRYTNFPILGGQAPAGFPSVTNDGWACSTGSSGTYNEAFAVCCTNVGSGTTTVRKVTHAIAAQVECNAGETRIGGGCENASGGAYTYWNMPMSVGDNLLSAVGYTAAVHDGWICHSGSSGNTITAYALCRTSVGSSPLSNITIKKWLAASESVSCDTNQKLIGWGYQNQWDAYWWVSLPMYTGNSITNSFWTHTATKDEYFATSGSSGTTLTPYAVCASVSSLSNTTISPTTEPQLGACCPPGSAWNSVENRCVPTTCGEGQFYCAAQKKCLAGGQTCDTAVCNNDGVCSGEESCQCADCVDGGGDDKDKCSIVGGTQAICSDDNPSDGKPGACCVPPKKWNSTTNTCVECSNTQAPSELKAGVDQPYITCTGNGDATKTHFRYRITKQGATETPFTSEPFTIGTQVLHPTMTLGEYTVECFYGNASSVDTSTTAVPHSCVKTMSVRSDAQGCSRVYPYKENTLSDEMISSNAFDASFRCGSRKPVLGTVTNPYMFRVGTQATSYLWFDALISELFNGLTIWPVSTQTQNYQFNTGNTDVTCATKIGGGYSTNTACQLRTCVGGACNVPQTFSVVHSDDLICTTEETSTYNIGCNPAAPDSVRNQCIQWFRDAVNTGSRTVANGVEFNVSFAFNSDAPTNVTCIKYVAGQMPGGLNLSDNVVCRATLKNGERYQIYAADTNGRIDALQTTAKTVERDREAPSMADIKYYTDESLTTEVVSTNWYNKPVIALAVCSDTPLNEATSCACAQRVDAANTTDADAWSVGVPNSLIGADLMRYTRTITETLSGTQKVQVIDTAGNVSLSKNIAVSLDTQAPLVTPSESGTGTTRTITLTASDTGSKIWKTTTAPSGATNTSGIIYRVGPKADMATLAFNGECNTTATFATVAETQTTWFVSQAVATVSNVNTATQVVAYCVRDNAGNTTRGMYPVVTDACFSASNMSTIPNLDTYKALLKTRITATGTDNQKYGYSFSENATDASCFRGILWTNITTLMANQLKPRTSTTLSNWDRDRAELSTSTTLSNGYYYYVYPTSNTLNIVTSPSGGAPVKSVVVEGGDIRIKTDINYSGAGKTLLLIARKNSNGQGGNIIIDTNVRNIDAILIADGGALRSSDATLPGERLTINGRVYSYNTRGGSLTVSGTDFIDSTVPKKFTNSSLVSASSLNDARIQDLERFRPIFADGNNTCSLTVNYTAFTTANLPALLKRPNTFSGGSCGF